MPSTDDREQGQVALFIPICKMEGQVSGCCLVTRVGACRGQSTPALSLPVVGGDFPQHVPDFFGFASGSLLDAPERID